MDIQLRLPSPDSTHQLALKVAGVVQAGDTFLLNGPVGAGKSFFARAMIQSLQQIAGQPPEDVPSPTFTLVQTYAAGALEIWHADLYRLTSVDEIFELGLDAAWDTSLCLIEWPDRLGADAPKTAVTCDFSYDPSHEDARALRLTGTGSLADRLSKALHDTSF